jgi:hypothetical protein
MHHAWYSTDQAFDNIAYYHKKKKMQAIFNNHVSKYTIIKTSISLKSLVTEFPQFIQLKKIICLH